jgi:cytochrome c oxidase subunit 3
MSFLSKITVKPWEHAGEIEGVHGEFASDRSAGRTGLLMFLAVISSMFLLFIITYNTRSQFPDWEKLTDPRILWLNTAVLILASVALQMASNAANRDNLAAMRNLLVAGGILTLAFIAGQFVAWEQLRAAGYYAAENPANAFFYLFTGLHALHLVGGLWFMVKLGFGLNQPDKREKIRQGVTLCATYWHYLLLVWLVLFALLLRT